MIYTPVILCMTIGYIICAIVLIFAYKALIFKDRNKKYPKIYSFNELIKQSNSDLMFFVLLGIMPLIGAIVVCCLMLCLLSDYKIYTIWHNSSTIAGTRPKSKKSIVDMKIQQVHNILKND